MHNSAVKLITAHRCRYRYVCLQLCCHHDNLKVAQIILLMWFETINEHNKISISNKQKYLQFIILFSVLLHVRGCISPISCCDAD